MRPFITDDARVVGRRQAQLESWLQIDNEAFEHWMLASIGPTKSVELGVGLAYGADWSSQQGAQFTLSGPLLQAKVLLIDVKENRWPGVAIEGGTLVPLGVGKSVSEGWRSFALLALTESLFSEDRLLIHGNLGLFNSGSFSSHAQSVGLLWGLGAQVRTVAGLHVVSEIFSGDAYDSAGGGAAQLGLRYMFNEHAQLDATVGKGIWGEQPMALWGTAGIRLVGGPWGP